MFQGLEIGTPDKGYDEIIAECERLGLIETLMHGEHQYARLTQLGINVLTALLQMQSHRFDPKNQLPVT